MLKKLIKHEWRSTYKVGCLLLFMTLVVTFLGWLSFQSPMWREMNLDNYRYDYDFGLLDLLSLVSLLMYVFMLAGLCCGIMIYLGVHFYKTMYTDQGYLTHTLPVGRHQLLISKILVSGIWMLAMSVFTILSAFAVTNSLIGVLMPKGYGVADFWQLMGEFFEEFGEVLDIDFLYVIVRLVVSGILSAFTSVMILFGSITVGQLFTKVRVLMAIVCYVVVIFLSDVIASLVNSILAMSVANINDITDVSMIVQLVIAVVLYIASYQIITKRLNME